MNLTINDFDYRLFSLITHYGILKLYLPKPMSWTLEMSRHLQFTETLLPPGMPHHHSRVFLELEMNDFLASLAERDLPPPQTLTAQVLSLSNEFLPQNVVPLPPREMRTPALPQHQQLRRPRPIPIRIDHPAVEIKTEIKSEPVEESAN